jgi:hypothetical protein
MIKRKFLPILKIPSIILALFFLIAGTLFFWYEYRPRMVREECSLAAEKMSSKDLFVYEICYRHCLRSNGIEYYEPKE